MKLTCPRSRWTIGRRGLDRSQMSATSRLASASWRPSGENATQSTPPGPPVIGGPIGSPVAASRSRAKPTAA